MSTKQSIKWRGQTEDAPGFHLYQDCFDDEPAPVYLSLEGVEVEVMTLAKGARVTVEIPNDVAILLGLLPPPNAELTGAARHEQE